MEISKHKTNWSRSSLLQSLSSLRQFRNSPGFKLFEEYVEEARINQLRQARSIETVNEAFALAKNLGAEEQLALMLPWFDGTIKDIEARIEKLKQDEETT
jgi:hypothetical protein